MSAKPLIPIEKTWCRGAELNCGHADFQFSANENLVKI